LVESRGSQIIGPIIITLLIAVAKYVLEEIKEGREPKELDAEWLYDADEDIIGVNIVSERLEGIPIRGKVEFYNGLSYYWNYSGGVYYVKIDDEWMPITDPLWKPGEPLSSGPSAA
jgi:hypothetical protein